MRLSSRWRPTREADIGAARQNLEELQRRGGDASPAALQTFELRRQSETCIRRKDLLELFNTEPDLSGGFTDVSRFVRGAEPEADVFVYWREWKENEPDKTEPESHGSAAFVWGDSRNSSDGTRLLGSGMRTASVGRKLERLEWIKSSLG